jgi:hypothetical protein
MPKIQTWGNLPPGVRQHLVDRMRDRQIGIADLNRLRLWIDSNPEVPEGNWYKDFGSFKGIDILGDTWRPKAIKSRSDYVLTIDRQRRRVWPEFRLADAE